MAMHDSSVDLAQSGFSLLELVAVIGLIAVVSAIAVTNMRVLENPLVSASSNLSHYFRLVRARAISQTRSILVTAHSTHELTASAASNCSSTVFTPIDELDLDIGSDVYFSETGWSVCFTQRGLVDEAVLFTIQSGAGSKSVEIALGGGIRIR
jgi:prepilin-type N-terminal cleavage/methylation domain-containing protein